MKLCEEGSNRKDVDTPRLVDAELSLEKRLELQQVGAIVLDGVKRQTSAMFQIVEKSVELTHAASKALSFS